MKLAARLRDALLELFSDREDPEEPCYDPVHLGALAVGCLAVIGLLYWLLWTLLVYERGIFSKLGFAAAAARGRSLPEDAFLGWFGNAAALALCVLVVAALWRAYRAAERRRS
ncbi:MAG: hypothetical protein PHF00_01575 [Elusimicrobia bacterium]|nr:hypothetical protein [Elusimicrobiota bacterium]